MWSFATPADFQSKVDWAHNFVTSEVAQLDLLHGHAADRRTPQTRELFRSLRDRVRSAGLWGPNLDRSLGGSQRSSVERVLLDEAIGTSRWAPAVFGYVPHQAWCARVLATYADPASRDRYLPDLWLGDAVAAYALNEPYVGGTKSWLRTTAAREGGGWVLRGEKWFIDDAAFADLFLVVARTRPGAPAREAFTLFLVPAEVDGVEILAVSSIGGQDPRHSSYGHVAFRDVKLSDAAVLGEVHGAYAAIQACRSPLELHEQGRALGVMRRCLEMMAEHAVTHESKRGPLAEFGTTRIAIGKTRYDVEHYRLVLLHAAWLADTAGEDASTESVLAAKAALPRIMGRVVSRAAHLHGALGLSADMPFASWRAAAETLGVSEGATESYWEDLGKLIMAGSSPRSRYTWPADHIPTATSILRESMEAVRWLDSPSTGV
jgi:acyl-CoA dehydrogenase